jgi:hypothetical protein
VCTLLLLLLLHCKHSPIVDEVKHAALAREEKKDKKYYIWWKLCDNNIRSHLLTRFFVHFFSVLYLSFYLTSMPTAFVCCVLLNSELWNCLSMVCVVFHSPESWRATFFMSRNHVRLSHLRLKLTRLLLHITFSFFYIFFVGVQWRFYVVHCLTYFLFLF